MTNPRTKRSSTLRHGVWRHVGVAAVVLLLALPAAAQPAAAPESPATTSAPAVSAPASAPPAPAAPGDAGGTTPRPLTAAPAAALPASLLPQNLSLPAMFQHADIIVRIVMIGLMAASVVTWTILLAKGLELVLAKRNVARALADIEAQDSFAALVLRTRGTRSPAAAMTGATAREITLSGDGPRDGIKERIASRLHRIEVQLGRRMNRGTGYLATIGAMAPFVGLFGTVWGIMNSFIGISQAHTTNLAVVAPGIAEALLATATGLVAAIPAVVIYNAFARGIGGYRASLADLAAAIERLASRDMDAQRSPLKLAAE